MLQSNNAIKNIDLSIIIINWNTKQLLMDCLASIYKTVRDISFELIVVDNGSTDGSVEAVSAKYPGVIIILNSSNQGFARANNAAMKNMHGKYALLLNSDTLVKESSLEKLFACMEQHPESGMCGPQLLNADGSKQNSVGEFPTLVTAFLSKTLAHLLVPRAPQKMSRTKHSDFQGPLAVECIIGACMMVRKTSIDAVGMLDEDYFFLYEETDWCLRMQKSGWLVFYLPDAEIVHLDGQSMKNINVRARTEAWRSRYLFFKKSLNLSPMAWKGLLLLGFVQNAYHFIAYSTLNLITLFFLKRLRRRWYLFAYLLVWHVRGRPDAMGIQR